MTTVIWEAGPAHPSAQVSVQVNGGPETPFAKGAKGAREVPVERNKRYVYILTASGQRLGTVTVQAR